MATDHLEGPRGSAPVAPHDAVRVLIRSIRTTTFDEATWLTASGIGSSACHADPAFAGGLVELRVSPCAVTLAPLSCWHTV